MDGGNWVSANQAVSYSAGCLRVRNDGKEGLCLADAESWHPAEVYGPKDVEDKTHGRRGIRRVLGVEEEKAAVRAAGLSGSFSLSATAQAPRACEQRTWEPFPHCWAAGQHPEVQ